MQARGSYARMGPAYYLGRPASVWTEALSTRRNNSPVAVVTGAGRGLGRLIARGLADTGVAVGLVARSGDELRETVELIETSGGVAASAEADVSDPGAIADAMDTLRQQLGTIDTLVNNAAITGPAGPAWEIDPESWWRTMQVNLLGTYLCTQLVVPDMARRQFGRIVNITSEAGAFRWPICSAYSVSKAAVIKFTENLAVETRRHGISVFSVHPGILPIGFSEQAVAPAQTTDPFQARIHAWIRHQLDNGHGAEPSRAVDLIVRLASGRYDVLSGRHLSVHDDVDALVERADDIRTQDLYLLGLQRLRE